MSISKVVCPNFGHPDLTLHFTKYKFSHVQKSFATIVNVLSFLQLFELPNSDLLFCSVPTASTKCVNLE